MFSKRSIERLAGAFLVASLVAFFAHLVTLGPYGVGPATIFCVFLYGLLVLLSAIALYLTFSPHQRALALFGAMGFAAHGLFVVLACALLLAHFKLAQELAATGGAEADSLVAAARALELAMDRTRTSAFVLLDLGLVPLGALIAWSGAVARWVGWLGILGGIVGFLGLLAALFHVVVGDPASTLVLTAVMSTFGFMLILGVRLVVRETREPLAARPQRGEGG